MTRNGCFLLALALAGTGLGCLNPMTHPDDEHKPPPVQAMKPAPAAPPIVTPDEVTEANAVEKAQALAKELDFAANERPVALSTPLAMDSAVK
jgi:hypothetical protein